jgi:hypothetical protein
MLNLVVTCVGSKNYEGPSIKNAIVNLLHLGIRDDVNELFKEWQKMLVKHMNSQSFSPKARNVYKGAMWSASIDAFNRINGDRQLWIISCGFGFINSEEGISGYHATFKPRENDSLYNSNYFYKFIDTEVKKRWWNLLYERGILETNYPKSIHELVNSSGPNDVILIAAGLDYYEAIFDDLSKIEHSKNLPKLALVGIQRLYEKYKPSIPESLEQYIQSYSDGVKLQKFLKDEFGACNNVQMYPKSARYLIEQYNKTGILQYTFP